MTETLHLLVTDDELGMRMAVSRALRNYTLRIEGYDEEIAFSVEQAETGEQALEAIEQNPPQILLLDHKLPGISGLDVLERIRKMPTGDMMTIMITAYASIETAVSATKRGAYDFLAKPFTPAELKETVRKATEHVILARQARRLAEEKRQVRFQFIRVLGHELKAPLGAIEGYLQILDSGTLGDNIEKYKPLVERSMIRIGGMRKLIADLLDLTRIESGQKSRELTAINIGEVADTAIEMSLPAAQERDITIELHAPEEVSMVADQGEMEIILNNMISNAVKYNKDGGRVDVYLSEADGKVVISVSDTGIGMTEAECEKLFGEFVRIRNEKTKDILGSGLGLSILKRLSSLYHGSVDVTSKPNEGSTFTVTLEKEPLDKQEENEEKRDSQLVAGG